jgi:hypothetical protein
MKGRRVVLEGCDGVFRSAASRRRLLDCCDDSQLFGMKGEAGGSCGTRRSRWVASVQGSGGPLRALESCESSQQSESGCAAGISAERFRWGGRFWRAAAIPVGRFGPREWLASPCTRKLRIIAAVRERLRRRHFRGAFPVRRAVLAGRGDPGGSLRSTGVAGLSVHSKAANHRSSPRAAAPRAFPRSVSGEAGGSGGLRRARWVASVHGSGELPRALESCESSQQSESGCAAGISAERFR